ncbi:MAG: hypothetical protein FIB07_17870 [Candidatus Methanoperedens sp.]|nr:hypothetical protein [Candidatus Methanoperedens sp.]
MKLSKEEANLFYKLIWALLFYTNQKYPVIKELKEPMLKDRPPTEIVGLNEKLFSHPELIDSFVDENPFSFTLEELEIIKSWKNFIKSNFLIMAYLRAYTVFLKISGEQKVYGVLGLHDKIRDVIPPFLPQYVETILMPFRGKIIYCGYIHTHNVRIGENLRRGVQKEYQKAKSKFGIITSLDQGTSEGIRK